MKTLTQTWILFGLLVAGGLFTAGAVLFAGAALAAPPARFQARVAGGLMVQEDAGYDVVSAQPQRAAANAGVELRLIGDLWLAADFEAGAQSGELYERDASYDTLAFGLGAAYRWTLLRDLTLFGRAGAMARRLAFDLGSAEGRAWTVSGRAGIGLEYALLQVQSFALGARLELTYERALPVDVVASGTSLGEIDASGPGALIGLYTAF